MLGLKLNHASKRGHINLWFVTNIAWDKDECGRVTYDKITVIDSNVSPFG